MNDAFLCEAQPENSFYIKFYPGIKSSLGCGKATLILGRFEYWFTKYQQGFYKFIEPCNHPLYRSGDSWAEEIGFSRKVFTKAFDLIGIRYKSKSAFQKSRNKFQGKLYASYHDRKTNQTYFFRNHRFANQFLKNLFKRKTPSESIPPNKIKNQDTLNKKSSVKIGRSWNGQLSRSFNKLIQKNTSSLDSSTQKNKIQSFNHSQQKVMEEMVEIWKEEIGEIGITLSESLLKRLNKAFVNFFDQSIESWKSYCRIISSSKFLMGESKNKFFKKAWITWAITENAIKQIRGGVFNLGDRQTTLDKKFNNIDFALQDLTNKKNIILSTIDEIVISVKKERISKTNKMIKSFSNEDLKKVKKEFEEYLEKENNSISEEYKKMGWKGLFVEVYFDNFIKERIGKESFSLSLENDIHQAVMRSGLQEKLQNIYEKINTLKKEKDLSEFQKKDLSKWIAYNTNVDTK